MAKCTCYEYQEKKSPFSDAVREGKLKLLSETNEDYEQKAELKCTICGQRWSFRRDDSYHYVIVEWTKK